MPHQIDASGGTGRRSPSRPGGTDTRPSYRGGRLRRGCEWIDVDLGHLDTAGGIHVSKILRPGRMNRAYGASRGDVSRDLGRGPAGLGMRNGLPLCERVSPIWRERSTFCRVTALRSGTVQIDQNSIPICRNYEVIRRSGSLTSANSVKIALARKLPLEVASGDHGEGRAVWQHLA